MIGGYTDADTDTKPPATKKGRRSKPNKKGAAPVCISCKQPGHWRPSNKLCEHCAPRSKKKKGTPLVAESTPSELQDMAAEVAALDAMPLDNEEESDAFYSATSEFS